jgi:hypothetical protein
LKSPFSIVLLQVLASCGGMPELLALWEMTLVARCFTSGLSLPPSDWVLSHALLPQSSPSFWASFWFFQTTWSPPGEACLPSWLLVLSHLRQYVCLLELLSLCGGYARTAGSLGGDLYGQFSTTCESLRPVGFLAVPGGWNCQLPGLVYQNCWLPIREINLLVKESVAQDSFLWLSTFSCIFLVVHQSHKNWESNCHNLQTVIRVQGLHTMGRCLVS